MTKLSIRNKYSDALYWATSTQTKDKGYHLTRTQEAILRKLIHYSKPNKPKITYSNKIIAQHTYLGEETIRKAIPILAKKGFLSTANHKIFDGEFKERRTIYIKWDFIEWVLSQIPAQEASEEAVTEIEDVLESTDSTLIESEVEQEVLIASDMNLEDEMVGVTSTANLTQLASYSTSTTLATPNIAITNEKFQFLKNLSNNPELSIEAVESWGQDAIKELFYGDNGIWVINDSSLENHYLIKYVHRGGSKFNLYNKNQINDQLELNVDDFNYYMEVRGIEFKDFSAKDYSTIKSYGLLKRPVLC